MELLERERCFADLATWLDSAIQRGGCTLLVGGEAGIGKTVLLREFAKRQAGARVLWGACEPLFTPRPLAPLHDVARQTQGALLAAVKAANDVNAAFAATLDELEQTDTLLILEDMHWADEASLDLLAYLGRRIDRTRALLVVSYRDDELGVRHPLRQVIGGLPRASTLRMSLAPLSEHAVAQLAREAGRPAHDLHAVTGGNPLFVTEVLAAAAESVPATVRDAVLARVARLAPSARSVAELVCVVPGKTEPWLLEEAAHPSDADIEGCLSIGMIRAEDASIAFRHELARRALEDTLPQQRRQHLHATALEVLSARADIPAARLAHHADAARDRAAVLRFARLAGAQAASVGAHREAASHYRAAERFAGELPATERAELHEQLAYECYLIGECERGFEAQRAALEIWRALGQRLQEGDALRSLSRLCWFMGNESEADHYCDEAIATLEALPSGAELAMAYAQRADLAMEAHEADRSIDSALKAIAYAETSKNAEIICEASSTLGTMRLIIGDVAGWADLNHALQVALANGMHEQAASAYAGLAAMAVSRRQYEQASAYFEAGLRYCEERDLDFMQPYILAYRARMRFERGEWNAASEDIETVLRDARTSSPTRIPALRTLAHLRVRRGDPDVDGPVQEARALAGTNPVLQRAGMLALVCAEAAWLADDRDGVIREVNAVYGRSRERRDPRMNGELAAWLWRTDALRELPADIAEPYVQEIAGNWRAAASAWHMLGCPYEHASLLAWYGDEAEQRQALMLFEQLGAAPAARLLRRRMRSQGVRSIPRGVRASTRQNSFGLTRREAEILKLLSEGMRSASIAKRLFVTTKTVEHHVSAILAKLGVTSRAQAVALARSQPASGAPTTPQ